MSDVWHRLYLLIGRQNIHLLAACCAAICLLLHILYFVELDHGRGLAAASLESDAYFYFYKAWYMATLAPDGGLLGQVISPSPYIEILAKVFQYCGFGIFQAYMLSALCTLGAVYGITLTTQELFQCRVTAFYAGLLAALSGVFIFYSGILFKSSLVLLEVAWALYLAVLAIKKGSWGFLCGALLVAVLASFDREHMVLFLPVALWYFVSVRWPGLPFSARFLAVAVGAGVVLWLGRSLFQLWIGTEGIGNSFGINFMTANAPAADGGYSTFHDFENNIIGHRLGVYHYLCQVNGGVAPSPIQFQTIYLRDWLDFYGKYPLDFVELKIKHMALLLAQYSIGHPEQYGLWRTERLATAIAWVDWSLVFALSMVFLNFNRARLQTVEQRLVLAFIVIYAGVLLVFLPIERYRLLLYLMLIPFAARQLSLWSSIGVRHLPLLAGVFLLALSVTAGYAVPPLREQLSDDARERQLANKKANYRFYENMQRFADERSAESLYGVMQMMVGQKMYYDAIAAGEILLGLPSVRIRSEAERLLSYSKSQLKRSERNPGSHSCGEVW